MSDYGRSPGQPAPQDGIFLPVETMSERTLEALRTRDEVVKKNEKLQEEAAGLRRQRSRAVLSSIVFGVAFLATLLSSLFAFYWANEQVKDARADAAIEIAAAQAEAKAARDELGGVSQDVGSLRAQYAELERFEDLSDLEIQLANRIETLANYRSFYNNVADEDLIEILETEPEPWNLPDTVQASNWISSIEAQLEADRNVYDKALKELDDWRVRRGEDRKPPANCTRSNPFQPETTC